MTKLSDLKGYSENAPKKKMLVENTGFMNSMQNSLIDAHNACHDAFSNLELDGDVEKLADNLFKDMNRKMEAYIKDDFCFVCGFPISKEALKKLCAHLAENVVIKDLSWLRIKGK